MTRRYFQGGVPLEDVDGLMFIGSEVLRGSIEVGLHYEKCNGVQSVKGCYTNKLTIERHL